MFCVHITYKMQDIPNAYIADKKCYKYGILVGIQKVDFKNVISYSCIFQDSKSKGAFIITLLTPPGGGGGGILA